jgi:DNA-directed RNA polymerase specialized sigma24 family protein
MTIKTEISQDSFEELLNWLDADREQAGRKYESIRSRLINVFYARGCHTAEELADETIDRVARKVENLLGNYQGEPALYFYAVAKKILLEYSRKPKSVELPAVIADEKSSSESVETYSECLEKCLQTFIPAQREFITRYYQGEKRAKLEQRKKLERELGISSEVLRTRAFRMRRILQKCVISCVEERAANVTF